MDVYVHKQLDVGYLETKVSNACRKLNINLISDINENFDNAISIAPDETVVLSANCRARKINSVKYDLSDKYFLSQHIQQQKLPYIPTILPLSEEEVVDFFAIHGSCIAKPRVGSGGRGLLENIHYKIYYSAQEFLSDVHELPSITGFDDYWGVQSFPEYKHNMLCRLQTILQKNVLNDQQETTRIRIKGLVSPDYKFNFRLIPEYTVGINLNNVGPGFIRKSKLVATNPNTLDNDHPFVVMVKKFLTDVEFNSSFFDCEAIQIGDEYYINDFSIRFPKGSYCVWDDKPRLESALKFIFGLSEIHEYPIDYWTLHYNVVVPSGITKAIYQQLESPNAKKYHTISEGETNVVMMIRGECEQECLDEVERLESIIQPLSV